MKTNREFLNAVITAAVNDEITEYATAELAKLDATNAKRREKMAEKRAANEEFVLKLAECLNDCPKTATDLKGAFEAMGITVINDKDVTVQKMSSLARAAVEAGYAVKTEIKVAGKGKQVGYTKA